MLSRPVRKGLRTTFVADQLGVQASGTPERFWPWHLGHALSPGVFDIIGVGGSTVELPVRSLILNRFNDHKPKWCDIMPSCI